MFCSWIVSNSLKSPGLFGKVVFCIYLPSPRTCIIIPGYNRFFSKKVLKFCVLLWNLKYYKNFVIKIPEQMENESFKNLQCEDVTSQPEEKDASANVHSDEPRVLNECPRWASFIQLYNFQVFNKIQISYIYLFCVIRQKWARMPWRSVLSFHCAFLTWEWNSGHKA